jgi:hypothetical protein
MANFTVGMFIRGEYIEDNLIAFGGRTRDGGFLAPDPQKYVDRIPLRGPSAMADLYDLRFDDILDYLVELGSRLDVSKNEFLAQARDSSYAASPLPASLVDSAYATIPRLFERANLRQMVESPLGTVDYLEGWVPHRMLDGRNINIRAFGARTVHIPAGNHPVPSLISVIRNALTRSDAIIKMPSNEPLLSLAIARTMGEMAPDHPITRHLTVAYWKGGDTAFESRLYRPHNLEKIVAWGGFAAMKHITQYIQPGLELISLDPKRSGSIVGAEAFASEESMREAAVRIATDVGAANQNGCVNARVIYVMSGTDDQGIERLRKLGRHAYEALMKLPATISTRPKGGIKGELASYLETLMLDDDYYELIGGRDNEGAMIVSKIPQPVEFAAHLNDRVANLVPIDSVDDALRYFDAYTQSVGIYPDSLLLDIRDRIPLFGVQRIVSLGHTSNAGISFAQPQDSVEVLRRMLKWIVHEELSADNRPMWEEGAVAI